MMSPGAAAHELGVSIETLRRWVEEGKLTEHRTAGGHRRVDPEEVAALMGAASAAALAKKRPRRAPKQHVGVVGYARAHPDASRDTVIAAQRERLDTYGCDEVVVDVASGLADLCPGLAEILRWVAAGEVGEVVVVSQDRLGLANSGLVAQVLNAFGARLTILEPAMTDTSTREELEADLRVAVAAYATRLFGRGDARIAALLEHVNRALTR
jgi:excisionase family DNA binding protein